MLIFCKGRDLSGLLFYFLDEILYHSVSEPFLAIKLIELVEFKADEIYQIKAKWYKFILSGLLLQLILY